MCEAQILFDGRKTVQVWESVARSLYLSFSPPCLSLSVSLSLSLSDKNHRSETYYEQRQIKMLKQNKKFSPSFLDVNFTSIVNILGSQS
jgi:hypothetical protein